MSGGVGATPGSAEVKDLKKRGELHGFGRLVGSCTVVFSGLRNQDTPRVQDTIVFQKRGCPAECDNDIGAYTFKNTCPR